MQELISGKSPWPFHETTKYVKSFIIAIINDLTYFVVSWNGQGLLPEINSCTGKAWKFTIIKMVLTKTG